MVRRARPRARLDYDPASDRLSDERCDLAAQWSDYALSLTADYCRRWPARRDDWRSAAGLALVLAASDWDETRGVPFPGFARAYIRTALTDRLRQFCRQASRREQSLSVLAVRLAAEELATTPADPLETNEEAARTLRRLRGLPPKVATTAELVWCEGQTAVEAARTLGIGQSTVCQRLRTARQLLKECP